MFALPPAPPLHRCYPKVCKSKPGIALPSLRGLRQVQRVLQPMIAKPILKSQLLEKPPFRFVHDVVSAVTKATGFGDGLFADREDLVDAKGIKDKQAKLDYLDRVILCVGNFQGSVCDVKGSKVVAGLEVEKTLSLFLSLAAAALASTPESSSAAVRRAMANEQPAPQVQARGQDGDSKEADVPGPSAAQAKPPPSRGGGQRNSAAKDEVAPRAGGFEVMGPASVASYEAYIEQCTGDINVTIDLVGALIPKPKMTEKLLAKPPFRFLHDIFSSVTEITGFGEGLLDEAEKDGKTLAKASKEEKIVYLEKIKQLVGFSLNTMVEARPAKIVAGLEPENTNRLLQLLAVAAKHCPDSARAVAMARGGSPSGADCGDVGPPLSAQAKDDEKATPAPAAAEATVLAAEPSASAAAKEEMSAPAKDTRGREDMGALSSSAMAKGGDEDKGAEQDQEPGGADAEPKRSMRPTTARRRPPKVKDNIKQLDLSGAGASGAAPAAKPTAHIIVDGAGGLDSDDEADAKSDGLGSSVVVDSAEGASKLVRDIENEARGGEMKGEEKAEDPAKGIRLGRIKKTADAKSKKSMSSWSEQDIEALQSNVQRLCQSTNPLGKCMDFVHEDLTAMSKEHERWQHE